jgi:peptide/nickel transport system permease protein
MTPMTPEAGTPILSLRDLSLRFPRAYGATTILRDVSLDLYPGETIGVVGESGSGKTLLGLSMIGLQPRTAAMEGEVVFDGRDLLRLGTADKRRLRGSEIAMIYQDALISLNPGMRIRAQLEQALAGSKERTPEDLLEAVQLTDTARFLSGYPHQLSGGQRQRVLIAMAIARTPRVVIADEPTTALDVTVQKQIIGLLGQLRDELRFALVLVSHDLGLVAGVADRIAVMYAGDLVELGPAREVLLRPSHPYTAGLIESSRSLEEGRERLAQITGVVPSPDRFSPACRFADRCGRVAATCLSVIPERRATDGRSAIAFCHFPISAAEAHGGAAPREEART